MRNNFFQQFLKREKEEINKRLPKYVERLQAPEIIKEAMIYSLNAGGKRLRPILLLATLKGYNVPLAIGYDVACAIEMIHTYSLIHDDLPAMDDDDLRRGKPTNHKVFGEAMAILSGDALLTLSFELLSFAEHISSEKKIQLIQWISRAAGAEGMVGGQVDDIRGENKRLTVKELEKIHQCKTGELIAASIVSGAILADVNTNEREQLYLFAKHLGLAFQIKDDILDVEGDVKLIGKPVGSDTDKDKSTYPKILGMDQAKEKLAFHINEAKKHLLETNMDYTLLLQLTDYVASRGE